MITVRTDRREVVFSASAAVASAPRVVAPIRRLILCSVCGRPLELEADVDIGEAAATDVHSALQTYDSDNAYRGIVRSGMTLLSSNLHLGPQAPPSRQCSRGVLVGPSPLGVYGRAWASAVSLVSSGGQYAEARKQLLKEHSDPSKDIPPLPSGIDRLFERRDLAPQRPVDAVAPLRVLDQSFVHLEPGPTDADGFVYLVHDRDLATDLGGPLAPERLVARCGGERGLEEPSFDLPAGLVIRDLEGGEDRQPSTAASPGPQRVHQGDLFA